MAETGVTPQLYGSLRALPEHDAERRFPGRTPANRPGLIVDPGDPTDRSTNGPVRVDRAGEVHLPGDGTDPRTEISMADILHDVRTAIRSPADLTGVDAALLLERGVSPRSDMPVWAPGTDDSAGFARIAVARA